VMWSGNDRIWSSGLYKQEIWMLIYSSLTTEEVGQDRSTSSLCGDHDGTLLSYEIFVIFKLPDQDTSISAHCDCDGWWLVTLVGWNIPLLFFYLQAFRWEQSLSSSSHETARFDHCIIFKRGEY
jgi:hypothetical protein